jgi:uncharacterized membrane protein
MAVNLYATILAMAFGIMGLVFLIAMGFVKDIHLGEIFGIPFTLSQAVAFYGSVVTFVAYAKARDDG